MFTYFGVSMLHIKNTRKNKKSAQEEAINTRNSEQIRFIFECLTYYLVISLSGELVYKFVQRASVV